MNVKLKFVRRDRLTFVTTWKIVPVDNPSFTESLFEGNRENCKIWCRKNGFNIIEEVYYG